MNKNSLSAVLVACGSLFLEGLTDEPLHRKQGGVSRLCSRMFVVAVKNFIPGSISPLSTRMSVPAELQHRGACLPQQRVSAIAFRSSSSLSQHFCPSLLPSSPIGAPGASREGDLLIKSLTFQPLSTTVAV